MFTEASVVVGDSAMMTLLYRNKVAEVLKVPLRGSNSLASEFLVLYIRLRCQMAAGKHANIFIIACLSFELFRFLKNNHLI